MSRGIAVLGATGLVGQTMLALLEQRDFPLEPVLALASETPRERTLRFRDRDLRVEPVSDEAFDRAEFALFAVPNALAEQWAPRARARGTCVIDCSSAFRYHDDVPLVVPEINSERLAGQPGLIANPNCSTIAIVLALEPLRRRAKIERVIVSTYQSVSGAGADAVVELEAGTRAQLAGESAEGAASPLAFNVVPHIDRFESNGYTREEMKIVWETRKILGLPQLPVSATAVRVPVRIGHAASVHVEFERAVSPDEAREAWRAFPGLEVEDDPANGRYPMPRSAAGRDPALVGRARTSLVSPLALEFFVASDNLRKGAALNAVQIAEALVGRGAATR